MQVLNTDYIHGPTGNIDKETCGEREDPLIGLHTVQPNAGTSEVANKGHEVHVDDKGYHSPDEATSHVQQDAEVT